RLTTTLSQNLVVPLRNAFSQAFANVQTFTQGLAPRLVSSLRSVFAKVGEEVRGVNVLADLRVPNLAGLTTRLNATLRSVFTGLQLPDLRGLTTRLNSVLQVAFSRVGEGLRLPNLVNAVVRSAQELQQQGVRLQQEASQTLNVPVAVLGRTQTFFAQSRQI